MKDETGQPSEPNSRPAPRPAAGSRRGTKVFKAAVAVMTTMCVLYALWRFLHPRPDKSLSEAVLRLRDYDGLFAVVPVTGTHAIGKLARGPLLDGGKQGRRVSLTPDPCFFLKNARENQVRGMERIVIRYDSSGTLEAELHDILGAKLSDKASATLTLDGLQETTGTGIPDLNQPCWLDTGSGDHLMTVVTTQIRASRARLQFDSQDMLTASSNSPEPEGNAGMILKDVGAGVLEATDITIFVGFSQQAVRVTDKSYPLGNSPVGKVVDIEGFEASMAIAAFDDSVHEMWLQLNPQLGNREAPPTGYASCEVGQRQLVARNGKCNFWLSSSALLSVRWDSNAQETGYELKVRGYRVGYCPQQQL